MYHHISPNGGSHCVHPDRFEKQIRWLLDSGFEPITGSQFQEYRASLWKPDRNAILITFDDGWLDNWCFALPLLEQLAIPAIFFIVTSWPGEGPTRRHLIGGQNWSAPSHWDAVKMVNSESRDKAVMRWTELRAAKATGLVELHSHSHTHGSWWDRSRTLDESLEVLREDLLESKKTLLQHIGVEPTQICWPSGRFTSATIKLAHSLGFNDQHSTLRGANRQGYRLRLVRRLHVENRGLSWFASRVRFYSMPIIADIFGWMHQQLYCWRMLRKNRGNVCILSPAKTLLRLK